MMTREQRQFIQITAALTMLIDHIGMLFFPTSIGFRAIGRLSFPLFAFGIAEGVAYTHDFWRYFGRILLTAILSQPVYMLTFGLSQGNPLFMLAWGAAALYFWRQGKKAVAAVLLLGSVWADMSYGWYGVWTIFFFGCYQEKESLCFYGQLLLNILYGLRTKAWIQMLSLFSFSFLDGKWRIKALSRRLPRYFFYAFYPLHLLVLWGIKTAI
ncbi:TraX family protein [Anaerotignum sp.]